MTQITWDAVGSRRFENGVDHGVLYVRDAFGQYPLGVPWNGLTSVTDSPSGAEENKQYADNIVYANIRSAEESGGTIEAFTYPDEFAECDGSAQPYPGIKVGQQPRKAFGLVYRTLIGNDLDPEAGYELHLVYGATASPSEKQYETVNESPEAITMSWEYTATKVAVPGLKPAATLTIDSTVVDADDLSALEAILFGTEGTDAELPEPADVIAMFAAGALSATAFVAAPTYNSGTKVITIPTVTGVIYQINGVTKTGAQPAITADTIVTAKPAAGYKFPTPSVDEWSFDF